MEYVALALGVSLVASLALVGFVVHRLYKLAADALVLSRAKDPKDYVEALEYRNSAAIAKDEPKAENKEEQKLFRLPDGRIVEPLDPWG